MRNFIDFSKSLNIGYMLWTINIVFLVVGSNIFVNLDSWNFRDSVRLFLERLICKSE